MANDPEPPPAAANPLTEATVDSIEQIFSMDPRDLTPPQTDIVIAKMREWRVNFKKAEAEGKITVKAPLKSPKKDVSDRRDLSSLADELGL